MAVRLVVALALLLFTQVQSDSNGRLADALDKDPVCQRGEACSFNALQVQASAHSGDERNVTKPKDWATPKACIDMEECQCSEMCLAVHTVCSQGCENMCWNPRCSCAPLCAPPAGPGCNPYCVANCAECGAEMSSCVDAFTSDIDAGLACLKGTAGTVPHCETCWQQVQEDPCAAFDGVYNTDGDDPAEGSPVGMAARRGYLYGYVQNSAYKESYGSRYLDGQVHPAAGGSSSALVCKGFAIFPNGRRNLTFTTSNLNAAGTKKIYWSNNVTWDMTHPL